MSTVAAGVLGVALLAPTASAAPKKTKARADSAVVTSGKSVTVKVLANDSTRGAKSKAKVRITTKSPKLKAVVTKKRTIKVTPKKSTKPGRYAITYTVTSKGRSSKAKLRITVKAAPKPATPVAPPASGGPTEQLDVPGDTASMAAVLSTLTVTAEVTTGYDRDQWKHWNIGANPTDGCDTRSEVLIAEAVIPVAALTKCPVTKSNSGGGSWFSYYDGTTGTNPTAFDIDHMVPLAEAHHSGGWAWDAATREAYANDLGDPRSLVAVSASSNRSKSDRDPAEWMPAMERCRYAAEWIAVKARWDLSVDVDERDFLSGVAVNECATTTVVVLER